jgi:hypothetical protein
MALQCSAENEYKRLQPSQYTICPYGGSSGILRIAASQAIAKSLVLMVGELDLELHPLDSGRNIPDGRGAHLFTA